MVSKKTQKWIEVAKVLSRDPNEKVLCPECIKDDLQITDIRGDIDPEVIERKIHCPVCGAKNYMRLKFKVI